MEITRDIVSRSYEGEDFDILLEDLITEIEALNYRITRTNHIDNIHERVEAGIDVRIDFERYKIVEFCNLNSCSELISANLSAGVFMPVKFIVYQRKNDSSVTISYLKPTAFAGLYDSSSLMEIAQGLEQDMERVLDEMDY